MYFVELDHFEGPLDLLLFFIRRDELDIFDIPIARITDEFLGYVRLMQQVDLDGVGDFIYMAAVLISIKAQMLLPRQNEDGEDEEFDPRRELVERLLEYVRYKEAADELGRQHEARQRQYTRGSASAQKPHFETEPELDLSSSVYDLVASLRGILSAPPEQITHDVVREEYTVEEQRAFVLQHLVSGTSRSFMQLVGGQSKPFVIATFLAVLEMGRQGMLRITLDSEGSDFHVHRPAELTEVPKTNGTAHE